MGNRSDTFVRGWWKKALETLLFFFPRHERLRKCFIDPNSPTDGRW
jgi:hypothetical protein